jgi:transposase
MYLENLGMASYPSSTTDSEWAILEPLLPSQADTLRGRPLEHFRRSIIDGILYIIRTGGA